jgi:very-short-patch-repair endonuclease
MPSLYNKNLKYKARNLRKEGTRGEALLWRDALKAKQLWSYQFNRQYPIGNFIVDFICRKLKLVIEIDGSSHFAKDEEDLRKQDYLEENGFYVLRFEEMRVVYRIDEVIATIDYAIKCLEKEVN